MSGTPAPEDEEGAGNIVSVSWPDHLSFGEGDGRLLNPDAVRRRMRAWRCDLGARILHWRLLRTHLRSEFYAAPGSEHPTLRAARKVAWDDLAIIPDLARSQSLLPYLYVAIFDEGWPLAPTAERETSYHNAMHCRHVAWQSSFAREHPQWLIRDAAGRRQEGVMCLAYPEVRRHLQERFLRLLGRGDFAGLFVCLRSQSRPAEHADQYGFNPPVAEKFASLAGKDLRDVLGAPGCEAVTGVDDLGLWRRLRGGYLTSFLSALGQRLHAGGYRLAVGAPRGDVLGPPLGNAHLDWRQWLRSGSVDDLVINQNSSRCPSMWHELWPMHRGTGYVQNYLDGSGMPPLLRQLEEQYGPLAQATGSELYVARQWDSRDAVAERRLLACRGVSGLVLSSFRHDNPDAVARGDWRA